MSSALLTILFRSRPGARCAMGLLRNALPTQHSPWGTFGINLSLIRRQMLVSIFSIEEHILLKKRFFFSFDPPLFGLVRPDWSYQTGQIVKTKRVKLMKASYRVFKSEWVIVSLYKLFVQNSSDFHCMLVVRCGFVMLNLIIDYWI